MADFVLHVRAYAPFDSFGGVFHGDGSRRGSTTSKNASARIHAWVPFDATAGTYGKAGARSDESRIVGTRIVARAEPKVLVRSVRTQTGLFLQVDAWGANPLAPGAPDIDVRALVDVVVIPGRLGITASMTGDLFPNVELFLADSTDERRMVLTYETDGGRTLGPMVRLWGSRQAPMGGICGSFELDAAGRFK